MMNKERFQRGQLSEDMKGCEGFLPGILKILEARPEWYGSVYVERKSMYGFMADLRKTRITDQMSRGAVLRVYDGYTLFERATDECEPAKLQEAAHALVKRVSESAPSLSARLKCRPYVPPAWKDRLADGLEEEITRQIPQVLGAHTPVHFGIRILEDPLKISAEQWLEGLRDMMKRTKELAPSQGLKVEDLTFILCRQSLGIEEALFVDRETRLSQTLCRMSRTLLVMSGPHQTHVRVGGLGGLETSQISDEEIKEALLDLRGLRSAEKLTPGKYRVLFGPDLTGVLAHEAFGHSQEGDTCARGRSKAWDLFHSGELVGNEQATILNNPAIFEDGTNVFAAWGSYFFDEEGWLARSQVLLDRGRLTSPMTNLTSAIRLGVPRTANGKREDWSHGVYTRQTNTYFSAGDQTLDELIAQIDYGFIATHSAGGMEDPKGMGIQVGIAYLKEVKNGKMTGRIFRGPEGGAIQMTGYTPDVLKSIIGKSKVECYSKAPDRARFPTNKVGGCGKYHKESVVAGCGGPHLLLDRVILG